MISVCKATFNGAQYIKQQLESILSQLTDCDELIISDDSSDDGTIDIISSLNDPRIKLLRHQMFHNPIFNFEHAVKHSVGDYIFLTDQDDIWFPEKITEINKLLKNYTCIVSDAVVVDSDLNVLYDSFFAINHSKKGLVHNLIKNGYVGCCMAFKKEILNYVLPFPSNIPMHDSWIGLISELYGRTLFYRKPLIYYRRHEKNVSRTSESSSYTLLQKLRQRIRLLANLVSSIIYSSLKKRR
jgi:glycosyltransferase involved in cell wall biosynthesis